MPTNNAINLTSSGIVKYNGTGTFSGVSPVTVPDGGTGLASTTAYAVLCGGTTSTAALQSIAGVGSSGQVLTSNGAGALPTFQPAAGGLGYTLSANNQPGNPADGTTYFISPGLALTGSPTSGGAFTRFYVPQAGTITKVYGTATVQGTLATTENSTFSIRLNNTTDTTVTNTLKLNTADNAFNATVSISVVAGDYIEFKFVGATWATNPTTVSFSATAYIS